MNMKAIRNAALLAAASVTAAALVPASASAETFNFSSGGINVGGNNFGNVRTFTGDAGTKVEVSAYSLNGNSLSSSFVGQYAGYGLGVTNSGNDGDHTIDNNGWVDFVVLQFDRVMTVSDLGIYGFGDTDLTWAVGNTGTAFDNTLSIPNYTTLDNLFNTFQQSAGSNSNGLVNRTINGATAGNLFMVAANTNNTGWTNPYDYFKLNSLKATGAVPEPATWGMMIGGFALVGSAMRRRKTATTVSFA